MKFGIIGCGNAASFHVLANKRSSKLKFVAAYDINEKILKRFTKRHKLTPYSKLDDLLQGDIDAVHINLPHYLHAETAIAAAKAGKHVLCEKPMATTLEDCDRMINTAKKAGIKLMIAENHRFLPAHQYIKKILDQGLIGDVFFARTYEGAYDNPEKICDPNHWMFSFDKGGGGALFDQGVHKFALLNWLIGEVEAAECWLGKALNSPPNKGDDTAMIHLRHKTGAMTEISVTTAAIHPPTNRLELHGTKGSILEDHSWEKPVQIYSGHENAEIQGEFYSPVIEHGPFPRYYTISFRIEDTYFAECILNDTIPDQFTPQQAKEAVAISLLSYLAAKRKTIVTRTELNKVLKNEGTESIFTGIDEVIHKCYLNLRW
ncbi:MAG: Gfo/Idh/MocA family protein [Candidatus Helarchaeota archaeon]